MRSLIILFVALMCLTMSTHMRAEAPPKDLVKAELLADTTAVVPGKNFTLGVRLTIKPEWHVYWKNPGDAGLPVRITWHVPEGMQMGELKFPIPIKFVQPGDVVGYGYKDEVMLTAPVSVQSSMRMELPVMLSADVKWLVCDDVCVPGKASLKIELPADSTSQSANRELFNTWTDRVPTESSIVLNGFAAGAGSDPAVKRYDLSWNDDVRDVEFFPPESKDIAFSDIQVKQDGRKSVLSFTAKKLDGSPADVSAVKGVVAFVDRESRRRGVVVPLGGS
jgi:DsbC/DsbD-like thiol-disulfide interchange protein